MARIEPVSTGHLAQVRLRGHGGRQIEIRRLFVRGNSVVGVARRGTTGLPAAEIRSIAVRRSALLKTTWLVVGTTGVLAGVVRLMACDKGMIGKGGM